MASEGHPGPTLPTLILGLQGHLNSLEGFHVVCTLGPDLRIEGRAKELMGSLEILWLSLLTTQEGPDGA